MSTTQKENVDLKRRVELLETIVEQMAKNIIHLKTEIQKSNNIEINTKSELGDTSKQKDTTTDKEILNKNCDIEITQERDKSITDELSVLKSKDRLENPECIYHYKECTYQCKKEVTLKKHINTKHTKQKCKVCDQDFETSIEMLKHVAEKHESNYDERNKERKEIKEGNDTNNTEKDECPIEKGKLKCSNFQKIVSNEDSFNVHKEDSQNSFVQ